MSPTDAKQSFQDIPAAFASKDLVLDHIKLSFIIGLGVFIVLFPFYRSKRSFFDAIAAHNVIRMARFFIIVEFGCVVMLFYFYFSRGSPLSLHAPLSYGNGDSWVYGYGRPGATLVFVCVLGLAGEQHPFIRLAAVAGCLVEIVGDALSAYQVHDYYEQVVRLSAPGNGYSPTQLLHYYYRDLVALGVTTAVLMQLAFLACIVGCWPPQLIHPAAISGYELDRFAVLRENRRRRREMEQRGFLGPIPTRVPRAKPSISAMLMAAVGVAQPLGDAAAAEEQREEEGDEKDSDGDAPHRYDEEEDFLL